MKLKGYASLWWKNQVQQRRRKHKSKIDTWTKLKKKLKERFLPVTYTMDLYNQLSHVQQGTKSVTDYMNEFEKLMMKLDLEEKEEQTMSRFLGGLEKSIARKRQLQPYSTLEEMYHLALKIEKDQKEKRKKPVFKSSFPYHKGSSSFTPRPETAKKPEAAKDKGKAVSTTPDKKAGVKSFKCQGYGHYQSDCPGHDTDGD